MEQSLRQKVQDLKMENRKIKTELHHCKDQLKEEQQQLDLLKKYEILDIELLVLSNCHKTAELTLDKKCSYQNSVVIHSKKKKRIIIIIGCKFHLQELSIWSANFICNNN